MIPNREVFEFDGENRLVKIETHFDKNTLVQKVHLQNDFGATCEITSRIAHIQGEQFKSAMIELGWTPPKDE